MRFVKGNKYVCTYTKFKKKEKQLWNPRTGPRKYVMHNYTSYELWVASLI